MWSIDPSQYGSTVALSEKLSTRKKSLLSRLSNCRPMR